MSTLNIRASSAKRRRSSPTSDPQNPADISHDNKDNKTGVKKEQSPEPRPWPPRVTILKVKAEKNAIDIDERELAEYIVSAGATPYPVTPDCAGVFKATRPFLSSYMFGGSPQCMHLNISPENADIHGFNDFMFVNMKNHPTAPDGVGKPGIIFTTGVYWDEPRDGEEERACNAGIDHTGLCRTARDKWCTFRLFVGDGESGWFYAGQYKKVRVGVLPRLKWMMLSNGMRHAWAKMMSAKGCGRLTRFRVKYRREHDGQEPTEEQVQAVKDSGELTKEVLEEDVLADFDAGKEHLVMDVLKCVGFDRDFRELIEVSFRNPAWEEELKAFEEQFNGGHKEPRTTDTKPKRPRTANAELKKTEERNAPRKLQRRSTLRNESEASEYTDSEGNSEVEEVYRVAPSKSRGKRIKLE